MPSQTNEETQAKKTNEEGRNLKVENEGQRDVRGSMPWGRTANSLFHPGVLFCPNSTAGDTLVLSYLSKLQPWRVRACSMTSPAQVLKRRKD